MRDQRVGKGSALVNSVWRFASLFVAAAAAACASAPEPAVPVRLEQAWRIGGLANPESVALSADRSFLYVSNVNGEGDAKDGNGFISRVSLRGDMLARDFATGLDAPKGLALAGDALFVSDIDRIVEIDAASGAVRRRIEAPGARFLNDAAVLPDGTVIASDSATQRIYAVRGAAAEVWLEDALLSAINGLLPQRDRLIVTTMAGRLLAVDYTSKAITVLAEGLGDADGVANLGGGRYLVTEWPGVVHVVDARSGTHETISDTRVARRFMNDNLLYRGVLYQAHWEPSELTAYRLR